MLCSWICSILVNLTLALLSRAVDPFGRNLVYLSPFTTGIPELARDTNVVKSRAFRRAYERRQLDADFPLPKAGDASPFADDLNVYPSFYGSDFSNSPYVWTGGVTFTHSVASGDPFSTSVILWTRAVPTPLTSTPPTGPAPDQSLPACISYAIFSSPPTGNAFPGQRATDSGTAFTSYDVDWTIKVEAKGLKPDTLYWYQFTDCTNSESASDIGQTRTLPGPNTPASAVNAGKPLTFAVFSCSQYQSGYFNAYGFAAKNTSADIFIHLGDYIYESLGNGARINRTVLGRELATIKDYRQRLGQYRTDESLSFAHRMKPWITVWDDHEVADNAWKAGTADSNDTAVGCAFSPSGACFTDRKLAAVRAYHEWLPIRQVDPDDRLRIWRGFRIGKLVDLIMLDTRQYDRDLTDVYYNTVVESLASFPNRSLMGTKQEQWLSDTLDSSKSRGAIWRILGQQIVFSQLKINGEFDVDAWDGYLANRQRILDHLYNQRISNTIILAGDSHANWVSDLSHPNSTTYDPATGSGAIGVEFAGTAVTSGSSFGGGITPPAADAISRVLVDSNRNLQWSEGSYRGFFTLTIGTNDLIASYFGMRNISFANLDGFMTANFTVHAGQNRLSRPVAGGSVHAGALKTLEAK